MIEEKMLRSTEIKRLLEGKEGLLESLGGG